MEYFRLNISLFTYLNLVFFKYSINELVVHGILIRSTKCIRTSVRNQILGSRFYFLKLEFKRFLLNSRLRFIRRGASQLKNIDDPHYGLQLFNFCTRKIIAEQSNFWFCINAG